MTRVSREFRKSGCWHETKRFCGATGLICLPFWRGSTYNLCVLTFASANHSSMYLTVNLFRLVTKFVHCVLHNIYLIVSYLWTMLDHIWPCLFTLYFAFSASTLSLVQLSVFTVFCVGSFIISGFLFCLLEFPNSLTTCVKLSLLWSILSPFSVARSILFSWNHFGCVFLCLKNSKIIFCLSGSVHSH